MLETDEVDVDYFTPASGTSLSKIFSNSSQTEEENTSLKYVPPLPAQVKKKVDEEKPTQCIYATALYAYEWIKDTYVSKERVGFAIMKIIKTGLHNIVLYDSKKTTLSCLTITKNTEINVKENVSISYYDNHQKYWNIFTTPSELNKILDLLKGLNVCLKPSEETIKTISDKDATDGNKQVLKVEAIKEQTKSIDKGSDTDSSINRRTKDSILKRMAIMGQSVLPHTHTAQTSDSSDSNETPGHHKIRHKPYKAANKRHFDKNIELSEHEQITNVVSKPLSPKVQEMYPQDQQIVAVKTIDMVRGPIISEGNDLTLFMSEQRVSNSEMRINVNRLTDKLDVVLDKVKYIENVDRNYPTNSSSDFQNEITIKLLKEYETKIKKYENFMKSKGLKLDMFESIDEQGNSNVSGKKTEKCNCKELIEEKDKELYQLKEQIEILFCKLSDSIKCSENLTQEIKDLKININRRDDQIVNLNKELESSCNNGDISNKLKEIMNDVFQNISANFDAEATYTGAKVKSIVASVIKKTTMESLKEFK